MFKIHTYINADILIQQETIRTNFVSSHHHCLIFIKYIHKCMFMFIFHQFLFVKAHAPISHNVR